jgi:monoamine oxidase
MRLKRSIPDFHEQRVQSKFEDWPNEKWTQCGYSCPGPTLVTKIVRRLYEPPAAWYRQESTLFMPSFGYMEGALQSGIDAAQTILRSEHIPEVERIRDERMSRNESRDRGT